MAAERVSQHQGYGQGQKRSLFYSGGWELISHKVDSNSNIKVCKGIDPAMLFDTIDYAENLRLNGIT